MSSWTNELLASMRQEMDPLADDTVKALFEEHGLGVMRSFHGKLVDASGNPVPGLPAAMTRYLEEAATPPEWVDPAKLAIAEGILNSHGVLVFMLLACASLPECYVDRLGMPVLFLTQKLNKDITRRVVETSKYVVDVLSENGFKRTGRGLDSARKVRLMHAAVRYLILHTDAERLAEGLPPGVAQVFAENNWKEEFGLPINQEDLAYTLQTFGWVCVRGMRDLKANLEPHEEEAIIHCWRVAGHYMGIRHDLLPESVDDSKALYEAIKKRVAGPSVEGASLTAAVLDFAENNITLSHFKTAPRALTRFLVGDETADMLGLPQPTAHQKWDQARWAFELSTIVHLREKRFDRFGWMRELAAKLFALIGGGVTKGATEGKGNAPFAIPESLAENWTLTSLNDLKDR